MIRFRRAVLWAALTAIVLLALLSVYGAFLGAERAQAFFNSLPLAVYWLALTVLLIVGLVIFRRLLQIPSLGGMWGSKAGHTMQRQLFGLSKIPKGQMMIREQAEDNRVIASDGDEPRQLPFSVRLKDFRMEYYKPGTLIIRSRAGQMWQLPAEPGAQLSLGDTFGRASVQKVFENFKLRKEDGKTVPYDAPGGSNPALQVQIDRLDGTSTAGYVFEQFEPIFAEPIDLDLSYRRMVRDYVSDLEIVQNGKIVAAKEIEVNHPLHYGGYHFYQHSYGADERGEYTVLLVVSDSGLNLVYGGYMMLIAGVAWHFWGRRALIAMKSRRMITPQVEQELPAASGQQE
jgi:hypothetical protein